MPRGATSRRGPPWARTPLSQGLTPTGRTRPMRTVSLRRSRRAARETVNLTEAMQALQRDDDL